MRRFHVHVAVEALDPSVRFYTTLFGVPPAVHKADYAKWMLDDPCLNFAISARGRKLGIDHLGLQVEGPDDLATITARLEEAGFGAWHQEKTVCCYAESEKIWVRDPQGIPWETFLTTGTSAVYGESARIADPAGTSAAPLSDTCCGPSSADPAETAGRPAPR
jgi:catechol 2,3-dioxygenase-like lactoylglutathione lyase family enzyme